MPWARRSFRRRLLHWSFRCDASNRTVGSDSGVYGSSEEEGEQGRCKLHPNDRNCLPTHQSYYVRI